MANGGDSIPNQLSEVIGGNGGDFVPTQMPVI